MNRPSTGATERKKAVRMMAKGFLYRSESSSSLDCLDLPRLELPSPLLELSTNDVATMRKSTHAFITPVIILVAAFIVDSNEGPF